MTGSLHTRGVMPNHLKSSEPASVRNRQTNIRTKGHSAWHPDVIILNGGVRTMKPAAFCLAALLLVACASPVKEPTQGSSTVPAANSPGTASRTSVTSQPEDGKGFVLLNGDVYTADLPAGPESWFSAVATDHGIVWSSPQRKTGDGTFTHPVESARLYISPFQKGGGDEHRMITDAYLSGGRHFMWRTEPGFIYWEQQSLSPTGQPLLLASKSIDLATGSVSDVPPGTAKQK